MISYLFFRIVVFIFRLLPFWLLYFLSDLLHPILNHIVRYRRKVVVTNLTKSFPEKSKKEIKKLTNKYYKHLSDITLESIKGYTLSIKEFNKRISVFNPEIEKKLFNEGKDVIFVSGHLGNWEWGPRAVPYFIKHKVAVIYKPIKNKYINKYVKELRKKDNATMYPIRLTARAFAKQEKPVSVVMLADQSNPNKKKAIWLNFLNQPTATLHGPELYAKKYDVPIVFFYFDKIKRGYYQIKCDTITETPRELERGQITKIYMEKLEAVIRSKPEYWIWSHKRWKHKFAPDVNELM